MKRVTAVWGVVLVVAGAIHLGIVISTSVESGFFLTTVYPVVYVTGLVIWTKHSLKNKNLFSKTSQKPQK